MTHPQSEYEAGELKKMIRARELKIANLQGENERLKGELNECLERMRKLQRQLLNGDVHRGRNTLQTKEFDSYDHTNQDDISQFCKNKLFPHQKFLKLFVFYHVPKASYSLYLNQAHACRKVCRVLAL